MMLYLWPCVANTRTHWAFLSGGKSENPNPLGSISKRNTSDFLSTSKCSNTFHLGEILGGAKPRCDNPVRVFMITYFVWSDFVYSNGVVIKRRGKVLPNKLKSHFCFHRGYFLVHLYAAFLIRNNFLHKCDVSVYCFEKFCKELSHVNFGFIDFRSRRTLEVASKAYLWIMVLANVWMTFIVERLCFSSFSTFLST